MMVLQVISMIYWMVWIKDAESGNIIYLLVGAAGIVSYFANKKKYIENSGTGKVIIRFCAFLFSVMIAAANYTIVLNMSGPEGRMTFVDYFYIFAILLLVVYGGYCLAWQLLNYVIQFLTEKGWKEKEHRIQPRIIFILAMLMISAVNVWVLLSCYYPGTLTPDSIWQIGQCLTNEYSNHHPFYHTIIIKLLLNIGLWMFHDINKAVMLYSIFQIVLMAGVFSYVIVSLYQMGLSWKGGVICLIWYLLMPFHIMYSFTMWKDVLFGGAVAIFLTSVFRVIKGTGSSRLLNYAMVLTGGMGMCLLRSNGWFGFVLTFVCFIILFRKEQRILAGMFLGIAMFSWLLLHPVLDYLNVSRTDLIESLSIPSQQIARVITDCDDITQEQKELLDQIVDTKRISEVYLPYISDPIKQEVRQRGRQDFLSDHKMEYIRLWLEIGIAHPHKYLEAWIDLTKGYWSGSEGRGHSIWSLGVGENSMGLEANVSSWNTRRIMNGYFWFFNNNPLLKTFLNIGFFTWVVIVIGVYGWLTKRKEVLFLTIPLLAIIFSLLIATPVDAEFRYVYAVFTSIPFVLFVALKKEI